MTGRTRDILVAIGIVVGVGLLAAGAWLLAGGGGRGQSGPTSHPSFQSGPVHEVTQEPTATPGDEQSGDGQPDDAQSQPAPDPNLVSPTGTPGFAPPGAKPVPSDPTLSIPTHSAVSEADAIAASAVARQFVTDAWNVQSGFASPWEAVRNAVRANGTDALRATWDAKTFDPTVATLLGDWPTMAAKGTEYRATTNLTAPTHPTSEADPTRYHATVEYVVSVRSTGHPVWLPIAERAPVDISLVKEDGQWKVSEVPDSPPPWIVGFLKGRPAK